MIQSPLGAALYPTHFNYLQRKTMSHAVTSTPTRSTVQGVHSSLHSCEEKPCQHKLVLKDIHRLLNSCEENPVRSFLFKKVKSTYSLLNSRERNLPALCG
jgi:hypothetical protein